MTPVGTAEQRASRSRQPDPPPSPPPTLHGERVTLSPVVPADAPRLRAIRALPAVARWWQEPPSRWPLEDRSSAVRFSVRLSGQREIIGFVQYAEESSATYRHASMDVFLDPVVHGRGLGVDTVRTLARHLVDDRGHHRLVIDPAADNVQAVRCYTLAGFRPVGILRSYERDPGGGWRDGLLMDALAGEIPAPRTPARAAPAAPPAPGRTAPGAAASPVTATLVAVATGRGRRRRRGRLRAGGW